MKKIIWLFLVFYFFSVNSIFACDSTKQACPANVTNYMIQQAQTTGALTELNPAEYPIPHCPQNTVLVRYRLTQTEASYHDYLQSRDIGGDHADCDGATAFFWAGVHCRQGTAVSTSNQYVYYCQNLSLSPTQWTDGVRP